jgi:uncharacterized membrane protein
VFLLSGVFALTYYIDVASASTVLTMLKFLSSVSNGLFQDFFATSSRPLVEMQALGYASAAPGVWHVFNRVTQYAVLLSLILGLLVFALKGKKDATERQILPVMATAAMLLGLSASIPFFAAGLNLSRLFHIALLLMSPCMVYGTDKVMHGLAYALKRMHFRQLANFLASRRVLAVLLLMSYFLCSSGWIWAASMDSPTSFALDWQRMRDSSDPIFRVTYFAEYTVTDDVVGAVWVHAYVNGDRVCSDYISQFHVLNSYGDLPRSRPYLPTNCNYANSYVYLSELNDVYGMGTSDPGYVLWPISNIATTLANDNRVYDNGGPRVYSAL